jgi:hypothetical protein
VIGDSVTWSTVLLALAAGAIGSVITIAVGVGVRLSEVTRELDANDRAIRSLDGQLETFVADRTLGLAGQISQIRARLASRGILQSGEYGVQVLREKERALRAYRDHERAAEERAAEIRAREGRVHSFFRARRKDEGGLYLEAPGRVAAVLERWAEPPAVHLSAGEQPPPLESDPRKRTVESTLQYLEAHEDALR